MNIVYLPWDSAFFNKKIGSINLQEPDWNLLASGLKIVSTEGYQLLYVFLPETVFLNDEVLIQFNGKLVDRKAEFRLNFKDGLFNSNLVEEYESTELTDDMEKLAYLSGTYSRFYTDKGFATDDYFRLYHTWISKSISKELANKVFVVKEHGKSVGMVTLKKQENGGKIGLIAVSDSVQGKGYGRQLIESCKKSLAESGIYRLDVATQFTNQTAYLFYEKCGFKKMSLTNIYHFWL